LSIRLGYRGAIIICEKNHSVRIDNATVSDGTTSMGGGARTVYKCALDGTTVTAMLIDQ